MFKWQGLFKSALGIHFALVVGGGFFALISEWRAPGSAILGLMVAGIAATAQGFVLNANGFSALWWSQGLKWLLLGLGTFGALNIWPQLMLPGFLVGAVISQLIWARVGMQRAKALRTGH
ncbi:MAG: hypothetical protein P8N63_01450 [Pseudomonadales bacterium]|nr:hypothetical protein [Pseudomonadales bacterium]